jgi:4-aminobutyrate aminotransferase-like enzyme
MADLLGLDGTFPGVAAPRNRALWKAFCPDPNLLLGIPAQCFPPAERAPEEILAARRAQLGRNLSVSYRKPVKIVRGWRQYLYDHGGRAYLDGVNNVSHVGHGHPRVVRAAQRQMQVLNTNTRYLHDNIITYAERLLSLFPDPLSVVFFVCSGSEANELALRLARTYTGRRDIINLDAAYHGNTQALVDISPYKHAGPGGQGAPAWAHTALMPDPYRGRYRGYGADAGAAYAADVKRLVDQGRETGHGVAALIAESVLGCGGQIVLPDNYLAAAYDHVRSAGGVTIADEVQVGFGRVGSHFWGFETQGVAPDIVTLGKPIGNGHPLGAVVTTPAIADAFANGMEYFNTFGGNPVSCAVGMAVLDVIEEEGLQAHAADVGTAFLAGLTALQREHALIGDVRGLGLFVGVELVLDRETLEPAGEHASYIANRMRDHGIFISTDGPMHNVLKLKPPMPFSREDADRVVETLDRILCEDALRIDP